MANETYIDHGEEVCKECGHVLQAHSPEGLIGTQGCTLCCCGQQLATSHSCDVAEDVRKYK